MKALHRLALAALALLAASARADEPPQLHTLLTPDSPAFTLLGVSPTQIQRPTDPTSLAHSLANSFTSEGGFRVPTNFALELAPFWLVPRPELTLAEYQAASLHSLYRKLTFSFASASTSPAREDGSPAALPRLGLGLRTRLFDGQPASSPPCQEVLDRYARELGLFIATRDPPPTDTESLRQAQQEWLAQNGARLNQEMAEQRCVQRASARQGFVSDFALAAAFDFPGDSLGSATLTSAAAWLNASYLLEEFSFIALGRWQIERTVATPWQRYLDAGARVIWARERLGLSLEALVRFPLATPEAQARHRVALIGDLEVLRGVWLTMSLGNGFNGAVDYTDVFVVGNAKFALEDQRLIQWASLLLGRP